ncbi:hypothetical protein QBC47DRAFT_19589 [Echria macrotheca]|uniref:Uncharacterized protein n=1 Tax=Echria macrotheca TaxID=438768 RepID=A0AAJ0BN29_9PEZI|nr:hypothetical protein QBC47DRAFT_19589 [Echria macrotheca]
MPPKSRHVYTSEQVSRNTSRFMPTASTGHADSSVKHKPPPSIRSSARRATPRRAKSRSSSVPRQSLSRQVRTSPSIFSLPTNRPHQTRDKMTSIVEESSIDQALALTAPAIVVDPPPTDETKKTGPWSEWYETRDQKRYWRARKLGNGIYPLLIPPPIRNKPLTQKHLETWDYQYSNTKPQPNRSRQQPLQKPPSTAGRNLASFFFGPIPQTIQLQQSRPSLPSSPSPSQSSRKISSSLFPPPPPLFQLENSSSTSTHSDDNHHHHHHHHHHHDRLNVPANDVARSSGTTFPSSVSTGKGRTEGSSLLSILSGGGTQAQAEEEGSSTLSKVDTPSSRKYKHPPGERASLKPAPAPERGPGPGPTNKKMKKGGQQTKKGGKRSPGGPGGIFISLLTAPPPPQIPGLVPGKGDETEKGEREGGAATNANGKKLHSKVKNEKEMRFDTKRRIRAWLKGIGSEAPEPVAVWDAEGLPVYR